MGKKGTSSALTLFRKYSAEGDHKRFRRLTSQLFALAEANGLELDEDGEVVRDVAGRPVFDAEKVHPLCRDAMRTVTEYVLGKPDQKVSLQGGKGGTRLFFTAEGLPYMGVQTLKRVGEDEHGEREVIVIEAHKNGNGKA